MNGSVALRPAAPPVAASLADLEVVERVLAGDAALFEILMRRYNQRLFRVARGIVRSDAEAEDVVQESWLNVYRALVTFRGESSFATWITRVAVHEASRRARRGARLVLAGAEERPEPVDPAAGPDRQAAGRELQTALVEAIDGLPEPLRAVFVLREVEGLTPAETAEALGISAANERVRLHRAKAVLRRRLDDRIGREARRLYLFDGARCDRIVESVLARLSG
jgi:RNA polymerase sigma-70 factor (ECF subfamily)